MVSETDSYWYKSDTARPFFTEIDPSPWRRKQQQQQQQQHPEKPRTFIYKWLRDILHSNVSSLCSTVFRRPFFPSNSVSNFEKLPTCRCSVPWREKTALGSHGIYTYKTTYAKSITSIGRRILFFFFLGKRLMGVLTDEVASGQCLTLIG